MTAQNMQQACQASATSDQAVAQGQSQNLADVTARKACHGGRRRGEGSPAELPGATRRAPGRLRRARAASYDPVIDPANFGATIDNPYFPLVPGTTFIYEGQTRTGFEHDEFAVTHNTRVILGVTCVEVHDTVTLDGELTEDTLDWFAQDTAGNVWYFGENSKELDDGLVVDARRLVDGRRRRRQAGHRHEGRTRGRRLLPPGVPARRRRGPRRRGREPDASATVPAGTLHQLPADRETTPIEPDALENKFYAPGVGNVLTVDIETGQTEELIQIIGP